MAEYRSLGSFVQTGAADETGLNPGNWTIAYTVADLPTQAQFEIYRAVVTAAPANATAVVQIGSRVVSFTAPGAGGGSEWDPNQPAILLKGQELYFLWSAPASGTPPSCTIWLRYDITLPENMS